MSQHSTNLVLKIDSKRFKKLKLYKSLCKAEMLILNQKQFKSLSTYLCLLVVKYVKNCLKKYHMYKLTLS